jgi:chromosome segregation ATPase
LAAKGAGAQQQQVKDDIAALQREAPGNARKAFVDQQFEAERTGRERIHRDIGEINRRLAAGDEKFERQIERIAALTSRLESTADQLKTTQTVMGQFVTRSECERAHDALERRLGGKE